MRGAWHHDGRRSLRAGLLALVMATAGTVAPSACGPGADGATAPPDTDAGSAFGAEISVTVVGRGRVTTTPAGIDCPAECFASLTFRPGDLDAGSAVGLLAQPTDGAHFLGWKFDSSLLGARGRGPDACSPLTREGAIPVVDRSARAISLPFGATQAWPPPGREAECAAFTTVPVGYAVTATFEDDVESGRDAGDAGAEIVFKTPAAGVEAHEIGVIDDRVYWRFQTIGDLRSGIATGLSTGGAAEVIVPATDPITAFDVDSHVVFQRASGQTTLWVIPGGSVMAGPLNGLSGYTCDAVASQVDKVYCVISFAGGNSSVYTWSPIVGSSAVYLYQLPSRGLDLAVDDDFLYSSDDQGGLDQAAIIRSVPRVNPGGAIVPFPRVVGQTSPRDLHVGSTFLYWLDGVTAGSPSARLAPKAGTSVRESVTVAGARLLAPDPDGSSGVFWVGVFEEAGGFSIVRASPTSTTPFRTKLSALTGLAVDASYVYWTEGDANVYRAPKPSP